jgi:hypothetical protein
MRSSIPGLLQLPAGKRLEDFNILWMSLHHLKQRDRRVRGWSFSGFIFLKCTFAAA